MKNIIQNPEALIELAEFYVKMGQFQKKYDHPILASNCFITAKTLLYDANVILEHKK